MDFYGITGGKSWEGLAKTRKTGILIMVLLSFCNKKTG